MYLRVSIYYSPLYLWIFRSTASLLERPVLRSFLRTLLGDVGFFLGRTPDSLKVGLGIQWEPCPWDHQMIPGDLLVKHDFSADL